MSGTWSGLPQALVFGPVISRRLGVSLGVNNVPYKTCTYSCVYCQLGRTLNLTVERRPYSDPPVLVEEVSKALESIEGTVDFVTFVPDGEPTLDSNLGASIRLLKLELWVDVAVLTNSSLLWRRDVRDDLYNADLVSLKVDAVTEAVWRRVNRPHPSLRFRDILDGVRVFAREYTGAVITETMVVEGVNDSPEELSGIAEFIASISPMKAYIMVPTRPPAEPWVRPASRDKLEALRERLRELGVNGEVLDYHEPPPPSTPEDLRRYVLSTIAVHPMRIDYLRSLSQKAGLDHEDVLRELLKVPGVEVIDYQGYKFLAWRPSKERG